MIQAKILFIEQELKQDPLYNARQLKALSNLKYLLNQIDFKAEMVPIENSKKLICLFESLKNETLTNNEKQIIKQLVKFN